MKMIKLLNTSLTVLLISTFTFNVFANPTMEEFLSEQKSDQGNVKLDEYTMSPLAKYLTKDQYKKFKAEAVNNEDQSREMLEGKVITFNTNDQEGCNAARIEMNIGKEVCIYDAKSPLVSVVIMRPVENREEFERKIDFSKLSEKEQVGLKSLATFGVMGAGAMGLIYSMPESVSKWDKSKGFSALAGQYKDRVKAGPVIDKDDWAVNYIGHPLSGAIYYTMVRHQGYSALQSAAFSFCMSTFFWEYGLEAFAEVPSIQDLILTPLIGSIIGEVFYNWGNAIEANGGKFLGSTKLGRTATILMNPAGELQKKINKLAKYNLIHDAELSVVTKTPKIAGPSHIGDSITGSSSYIGLQLKFKF